MPKEPSQAMLVAESCFFSTLANQPLASHTPETIKKVAASAILAGQTFEACWKEWERSSEQALMDKAQADAQTTEPPAPQPERKVTKSKRAKRKPA